MFGFVAAVTTPGLVTMMMILLATGNNPQLESQKQRWQIGYETSQEAEAYIKIQQYKEAISYYTDALNIGRKPALALYEHYQQNQKENKENEDDDDDVLLGLKALDWLIEIFCKSSKIKLQHLNDIDGSRSDAWAACVYSQYEQYEPLLCMKQVCEASEDLIGENQAIQQLLAFPTTSTSKDQQLLPNKQERIKLSARMKEITIQLEKKYNNK